MRKVQIYSCILSGVFLLWIAAQATMKPTQGTGRIIEDFKEIPLQIGEWSGIEGRFDEVSRNSLPHCALMTRDYENEEGYDTNLSIVYGVDLGDFHQPEYCMEGQGWKRVSSRIVTVPSAQPHKAVMMHMVSDYHQIVVLYWFASEGMTTTELGRHKLTAFLDRLKKHELEPSAMIRFISPVESDMHKTEKITLDMASTVDPFINKTLEKAPVFEDSGTTLLEE